MSVVQHTLAAAQVASVAYSQSPQSSAAHIAGEGSSA